MDRERTLQHFRITKLGVDGDPLVLALNLGNLFRLSLATLDEDSVAQLLASQFIESVSEHISQQLHLIQAVQPMEVGELAKVTR